MEESDKSILKKFNIWRKNEYLCDITLVVEGIKFPCHRIVIASRCSYFYAMFGNFKEKDSNEVVLTGLNSTGFEDVLYYLYVNEININRDNVKDLLFTSDMLGIEILQERCVKFVQKANVLKDIVDIYIYADLHNNAQLLNKLKRFICEKFSDICNFDSRFLDLNYDGLKLILESEDLTVEKDEIVFDGVLKWIKYDQENRLKYMERLLPLIKVPSLSSSYMINLLLNEEIVRNDKRYLDMIVKRSIHSSFKTYKRPKPEVCEPRCILFNKRYKDDTNIFLEIFLNGKLVQNFDLSFSASFLRSVLWDKNTIFVLWTSSIKDEMKFEKINLRNGERTNINSPPVFANNYSLQTDGNRIYLYCSNLGLKNNSKSMIFTYDLQLNIWIRLPDVPTANGGKFLTDSCFKVHEDKLYVIGGCLDTKETNLVFSFDLRKNNWNILPPMIYNRRRASACFVNGKLYVSGGILSSESMEKFNFSTRQWTRTIDLPTKRFNHSMLFRNNKLYVIGGLWNGATIVDIDVSNLTIKLRSPFALDFSENDYCSKSWKSVNINRPEIMDAIGSWMDHEYY